MDKKNEIWKLFVASVFSLFLMVGGFFSSELTYEWRENLHMGKLIFENKNNYMGQVYIEAQTGEIQKINNLYDGLFIYLKPGQYNISQSLGELILKQDTIDIERKEDIYFELEKNTEKIFYFTMNLNRNKFGPGDSLLLSLSSTKNTWVYLFCYLDGEIIQLYDQGLFLKAYKSKVITNISAKKFSGNDNVIAIALEEDNKELARTCMSSLVNNSKSYLFESEIQWRSQWVSFIVE